MIARSRRLACSAALALGAALAAASVAHVAQANGRPPATNGIHFRPGDPHTLYIASTFGLLVSHDDGCTMRWICEVDLGYSGRWRFAELAGALACPDGTAERDACDRQQWQVVQAQFAATGPVCGAPAADVAPPSNVPPPSHGCCDTGGAQSGLVGTCAVVLWLGRRRRRMHRASR